MMEITEFLSNFAYRFISTLLPMKSILPAAMAFVAASAAFAYDPSARVSCGAPDGEADLTVAAPEAVADSLTSTKRR